MPRSDLRPASLLALVLVAISAESCSSTSINAPSGSGASAGDAASDAPSSGGSAGSGGSSADAQVSDGTTAADATTVCRGTTASVDCGPAGADAADAATRCP